MAPQGPRQSVRRHFGNHFNEGARLLWLVLEARGLGPENVTAILNRGRGMSTKWLYGDQRPSGKVRAQIEAEFGVGWMTWDAPPAEVFVLPALRVREAG